jgi:hypothetical protein
MRLTSVKEYEKVFSGGEPTWKNGETSITKALNWYNYHSDSKESKKYTIQYLKDKKEKTDTIELFERAPEDLFSNLGFVCRIKMRGAPLSEKNEQWISDSIEKIKSKIKPATKEKLVETKTVTIQDRIAEKSKEIIGELESVIDDCFLVRDFDAVDPYEVMQNLSVKSVNVNHIVSFFQRRVIEIEEVISSKDAQLTEGYSNFTKSELKQYLAYIKKIIADAEKISHVKKLTRAPRKKKAKPVDKVVGKMQYKKEDSEYKIASVNPVDIVGCSQLWVFNTKTRKLGVYNSIDGDGLSVKGTTLLNFNETASIHKTVRKPEVVLQDLLKAGKVNLRKFMSSINSVEQVLTGRINSDTILLRIIK